MAHLLYDRCKCFIVDYACRMKMPSGSRLPAQRQLCNLTGMSMITVRRAIAELEQEKFLKTMSGKGVFLQKDCSSAPDNGEVVFFDVQQIYRADLVSDSLRVSLNHRGCKLRSFACGENVSGEHRAAAANAIGIIFMGMLNEQWLEMLRNSGKPVVIMGRDNGPVSGIPTVVSNNEGLPETIVEFFVSKNCRRFALLNASEDYKPANVYQQGIEMAVKKFGVDMPPEMMLRLNNIDRSAKVYDFLKKNHGGWDCLLVQRGILLDLLAGCMELGIDPGMIGVFDLYWYQNSSLNSKIFYFGNPVFDVDLALDVLFDQVLPVESRRYSSNWIQVNVNLREPIVFSSDDKDYSNSHITTIKENKR